MACVLDVNIDNITKVAVEPSFTENTVESSNKDRNSTNDPFDNLYTRSNLEKNKEQKNTADKLLTIEPDDCILWQFSDRPHDELGNIKALAESLKTHGQQLPILVRKNTQNTPHKYEIIFGNRRWQAAQIVKLKLKAIYKNLTDQQASICQREENDRVNLSNYAKALSYRALIDGGVFQNESELCRAHGLNKQTFNDLMAYLRVPEKLREAISNYKMLSNHMVRKLASLSKDKDTLDVLIHLAPKISNSTVTTSNLKRYIHTYLAPTINKSNTHKHLYEKRDSSDQLIYKTKLQSNGDVSLILKRQIFQGKDLEVLHERFEKFLEQFLKEE